MSKSGVKRNLQFSNLIILIIFISCSVSILIFAYGNISGQLTNDSTKYLRLSKMLLQDKGFNADVNYDNYSSSYFAIWPIGYPILIFVTAIAFRTTDVFLSSKIVNILLLGLSLLLLKKAFKANAWVYGVYFLSGGLFHIFCYTWSEVPFIFGLLWFCISLYYFTKNKGHNIWLINILVSMLFLFLSRYIGIFTIFVIIIACLYLIKQKNYQYLFKISSIGCVFIIFVGFYLYINYQLTGHITGISRPPSPETNLFLLMSLAKSQLGELNFLLSGRRLPLDPFLRNLFIALFILTILLQFIIYLYIAKANKNKYIELENSYPEIEINKGFELWIIFLIVGLTYWIIIVLLRWFRYFDLYSYRSLAPASILFYFSLVQYLYKKQTRILNNFKQTIAILAILSVIINVSESVHYLYKIAYSNNDTFYIREKELQQQFNLLKPDSLVLGYNDDIGIYLNYMRTDILFVELKFDKDIEGQLNNAIKYNGYIYFIVPSRIDRHKSSFKFLNCVTTVLQSEILRIK